MNAFCVKHDMFRAHCDCSLLEDTPEAPDHLAGVGKVIPATLEGLPRHYRNGGHQVLSDEYYCPCTKPLREWRFKGYWSCENGHKWTLGRIYRTGEYGWERKRESIFG